jgi:hypothetical protein
MSGVIHIDCTTVNNSAATKPAVTAVRTVSRITTGSMARECGGVPCVVCCVVGDGERREADDEQRSETEQQSECSDYRLILSKGQILCCWKRARAHETSAKNASVGGDRLSWSKALARLAVIRPPRISTRIEAGLRTREQNSLAGSPSRACGAVA